MVLAIAVHAAPASAITRAQVLARANHWIKKRVQYSQSSYYDGYRQDCSGFVSMAWRLHGSYTSSDIGSRAKRIKWSRLKPGDAVRRPGHVEIFDGWKNKRRRQYWALEESTWGEPALRRVKTFKGGYTALRLRGIQDDPTIARRPPAPVPPSPVPPAPSEPGTPSAPPTSSIEPTAGALPGPGTDATPGVEATATAVSPISFALPATRLTPFAA